MSRALAAAALGLLLMACGGGDGAFAAEFRALSSGYEERLQQLEAQADAPEGSDTDGAAADVYEQLLDLTIEARDEYAALEPPERFAPAVDRIEHTLERQERALRGLLDAMRADDADALTPHLRNLQALVGDWARTNQLVLERL